MISGVAYSRITLALDIIKKLETGYHELNIIKQEINLCDEISIEEAEKTEITCNYDNIPLDDSNLCIKALNVVKKMFNINKNVSIDLEKSIPPGSGLAGGSSDAATTIKLLNTLWKLNMTKEQMLDCGFLVGMDVPYFFIGGTAFDTEATQKLEQLKSLPQKHVILINPGFSVSTKEAYANVDYNNIGTKLSANKMKESIEDFNPSLMHNDFESIVFPKYPELKKIKDFLEEKKINALMSGSGSTIFGITEDYTKIEQAYDNAKRLYPDVILTQTK